MDNKYELRIYPDAVLRHRAHKVKTMNGEIYEIIKAMKGMMYEHQVLAWRHLK